jgi:hypothetical protein
MSTCRPAGGPTTDGEDAPRWDPHIQEALYNGWKSIHGLKHQTVDNAYGCTEDICGPTSLRRNDLYLFGLSEINERFRVEQLDEEKQYVIFGDSAYKVQSHCRSYYKADEGLANHEGCNCALKHVRVSIEWNYMVTSNSFKYVKTKSKLKVLSSDYISKVYTVATLFRNFKIMCYGNLSSNYFGLTLPENTLEHYINQTNF